MSSSSDIPKDRWFLEKFKDFIYFSDTAVFAMNKHIERKDLEVYNNTQEGLRNIYIITNYY